MLLLPVLNQCLKNKEISLLTPAGLRYGNIMNKLNQFIGLISIGGVLLKALLFWWLNDFCLFFFLLLLLF